MEFPMLSMEKLLKKANVRVSKDAVKEFSKILEEIAFDISSEACANAKRAHRATVSIEDVSAAKRKIL